MRNSVNSKCPKSRQLISYGVWSTVIKCLIVLNMLKKKSVNCYCNIFTEVCITHDYQRFRCDVADYGVAFKN